MERERAEREYEREEAERRRRREHQKRVKRMLEAAFDGDCPEIKKVLQEVRVNRPLPWRVKRRH